MKTFVTIVGILIVLAGVVWFLQGINLLGGSSMTGQSQWAIYGVIAIGIGVVLLVINQRRNNSRR
jgi:divalent metal cation (Fe/Co/Zn/Cd) transporter